MTKFPLCAAIIICVLFANPAFAEEQVTPVHGNYHVSYADLELSRDGDRMVLLDRINGVIKRGCQRSAPLNLRSVCERVALRSTLHGANDEVRSALAMETIRGRMTPPAPSRDYAQHSPTRS
jgi:hypothetical protein